VLLRVRVRASAESAEGRNPLVSRDGEDEASADWPWSMKSCGSACNCAPSTEKTRAKSPPPLSRALSKQAILCPASYIYASFPRLECLQDWPPHARAKESCSSGHQYLRHSIRQRRITCRIRRPCCLLAKTKCCNLQRMGSVNGKGCQLSRSHVSRVT